MPDTLRQAQRQLKAHHYRLTIQRQNVLALLAAHQDHHWSAEQVCDALQTPEHKGPSLATIYRTLALLEELRMIHHLDAGDGTNRYSLGSIGSHVHWVCLQCQRVSEGTLPDMNSPSHPPGFQVVERSLVYYGYCNECQTREEVTSCQEEMEQVPSVKVQ